MDWNWTHVIELILILNPEPSVDQQLDYSISIEVLQNAHKHPLSLDFTTTDRLPLILLCIQ